jgi:hypothetical protein
LLPPPPPRVKTKEEIKGKENDFLLHREKVKNLI